MTVESTSSWEQNWEAFLTMVRAAGLDADDPHMEELYGYLQVILPGLRVINDLDLSGVDPSMVYFVPQE